MSKSSSSAVVTVVNVERTFIDSATSRFAATRPTATSALTHRIRCDSSRRLTGQPVVACQLTNMQPPTGLSTVSIGHVSYGYNGETSDSKRADCGRPGRARRARRKDERVIDARHSGLPRHDG